MPKYILRARIELCRLLLHDLAIIERAGWGVYRVPEPYALVDRYNTVNSMLCNANGVRRLLISPKCRHLIKALDGLVYKEGTNFSDPSSNLDHITDALGYLIMGRFPMKRNPQSFALSTSKFRTRMFRRSMMTFWAARYDDMVT
ncbi:MAG: hypothetical protein DMG89_01125 [Acidobacteria bacterium]|nr:MAG: hypothetical protein DMG89_01125 [Acidobacteriota bacterium]